MIFVVHPNSPKLKFNIYQSLGIQHLPLVYLFFFRNSAAAVDIGIPHCTRDASPSYISAKRTAQGARPEKKELICSIIFLVTRKRITDRELRYCRGFASPHTIHRSQSPRSSGGTPSRCDTSRRSPALARPLFHQRIPTPLRPAVRLSRRRNTRSIDNIE